MDRLERLLVAILVSGTTAVGLAGYAQTKAPNSAPKPQQEYLINEALQTYRTLLTVKQKSSEPQINELYVTCP